MKKLLVSVLILLVLGCFAAGGIFYINLPKVRTELTLEVGSSLPELSEFLVGEYEDTFSVVTLVSEQRGPVELRDVGDYTVTVKVLWKEYHPVIHVVDTIAPVVTTKDNRVHIHTALNPMDFIGELEDATATTVEFEETPDFDKAGRYEVVILVTDQGGNVTKETAQLEVYRDTVPPVIEGVEDITITAGGSVSYKKNITVTDNNDAEVELAVDNSQVDLNTPGDYPITYIACDSDGNVTTAEAVLHVKPAAVEEATEALVYAEADKVLAEILTEEMSQYEAAEAIFYWVHEKIGYEDGTPKTDWVQGAYRGLVERKGDCFVYAMTSKCLLTRAGIANMDIEKIPTKTRHYWNLIDIGDGWYHFDATRRTDGASFFYCTDEELMAYSDAHYGSHNYDASLYPEIQ